MTWTPALTELRAALEEALDSPDTIGMVVDEARHPRAGQPPSAPPRKAWHAVLTEGARLNRVEALIAARGDIIRRMLGSAESPTSTFSRWGCQQLRPGRRIGGAKPVAPPMVSICTSLS